MKQTNITISSTDTQLWMKSIVFWYFITKLLHSQITHHQARQWILTHISRRSDLGPRHYQAVVNTLGFCITTQIWVIRNSTGAELGCGRSCKQVVTVSLTDCPAGLLQDNGCSNGHICKLAFIRESRNRKTLFIYFTTQYRHLASDSICRRLD
jgi:hypothetical protein